MLDQVAFCKDVYDYRSVLRCKKKSFAKHITIRALKLTNTKVGEEAVNQDQMEKTNKTQFIPVLMLQQTEEAGPKAPGVHLSAVLWEDWLLAAGLGQALISASSQQGLERM